MIASSAAAVRRGPETLPFQPLPNLNGFRLGLPRICISLRSVVFRRGSARACRRRGRPYTRPMGRVFVYANVAIVRQDASPCSCTCLVVRPGKWSCPQRLQIPHTIIISTQVHDIFQKAVFVAELALLSAARPGTGLRRDFAGCDERRRSGSEGCLRVVHLSSTFVPPPSPRGHSEE